MLPPEYALLGQQILGLILAFADLQALNHLLTTDQSQRRVGGYLLVVVLSLLWLAVAGSVFFQTRAQARESAWVRDRARWLTQEIDNMIKEADTIRYRMLTKYESDLPQKEKLRQARQCYTPMVNQFRESTGRLLADEASGAHAPSSYDFGFGKGTTEWNVAILNGAVSQLISASNAAETLASRSTVPRSHVPNTPYRSRKPLSWSAACTSPGSR